MQFTRLEKIIFAVLIAFLVWSRFWLLDIIPATLSHDEMVYAIQAKSFAVQGVTFDQQLTFWSLKPSHPMYAELPAQVMALGFLLSDNPLFATHLTSALMSITLPFIMAGLVFSIWRRPDVAKATWIVFVFNPLFWQMGRLSYDAFYGLWFYALGGLLFLQLRSRLAWISLPFFFIGFFQYQGFKLVLVPWLVFLFLLILSTQVKKFSIIDLRHFVSRLKPQLIMIGLAVGLMAFYGLVMLPQQAASSRLTDLIFTDTQYQEQIVNTERRLSLNNPFSAIASNKITATGLFLLQRLIGVFNPTTLLVLVEPNVSGFSVWTHGLFYWLEIGLFFVGMAGLIFVKRTRIGGILLLLGMMTLCLPALINSGGEWYLLRSLFSYLLLTIAAAWGLTFIWQHHSLRLILMLVYLLSILNFSYHLFYRFPVISLDWSNFDERILARYLALHHEHYPDIPVTVFTSEPEYDFWSYVVYNNLLSTDTADGLADTMRQYPPYNKEAEYTVENIRFSGFCAPVDPIPNEVLIIRNNHENPPNCGEEVTEALKQEIGAVKPRILSISAVLDSGQRMKIFGDLLCGDRATTFIHVQSISELGIEQQDKETFCPLWIKDLNW